MRLALLSLLLSGCALLQPPPEPPALCVTRCGLRLVDSKNPALVPSCAELQALEDRTIAVFTSKAVTAIDPRFADACRSFSLFELKVGPVDLWHPTRVNADGSHAIVNGYTDCGVGVRPTVVYSWRPNLDATALAHELAHAAQGCYPLPPIDPKDPDHSGWAPLYAAGVQ